MIAKEKQEAEPNIHDDYVAKLQKYMNKGAEAAQPCQEKKAQQDEVDALVLDLLKQVMTESGGSHPKPEPAKAESLHLSVGTQKPKADIPKPAPEKSAVKESHTEKPSTAKASPAPVASKPATPVSAASAKQKSKTPFIAIACVCALVAIGIPVYMFTGSSSQASKSAASLPAATAAPAAGFKSLPADQTAAVPIVKVVPKHPNLGVRGGISGSVVLELSIDGDGMVVQSTPISGNWLFYNAAIETANQWRFKPATANGKNVASRTRITLYFSPQR
jgi:TonB family protein